MDNLSISTDFLDLWKSNKTNKDFAPFKIKPLADFPEEMANALLQQHYFHNDFISGLCVTKDFVFTASEDGSFKIHQNTGYANYLEFITEFEGVAVNNVLISPCGQYVVTADDDFFVKIYQKTNPEDTRYLQWRLLHTLEGHTDYVSKIDFAGDSVISASKDGDLKVWDYKNGRELETLKGHNEWIYALAVSPDQKRLVSGALDSSLKIWDLDTYECLQDLVGGSVLVYVMGMTVGGSNDTSKGNKDAINDVKWVDNEHFITSSKDVVMWNANTYEVVWQVDSDSKFGIKNGIYVPHYKLYIGVGQVIEGWNVDTGEKLFLEVGHEGTNMHSCFYFFDESNAIHLLYTTDENGLLKIWNIAELLLAGVSRKHSGTIFGIKYEPTSKQIISASFDEKIILHQQNTAFIKDFKYQGGSCPNFLANVPNKPHQSVWAWQGQIIILDALTQELTQQINLKSNLIVFDFGIFINDVEIMCFSLCYLARIINIETKEMTVLETKYSLTSGVWYAPNILLCNTYPINYLDNKEEVLEEQEHCSWINLHTLEEIKKIREKEQKQSPFLLLDIEKKEIIETFDVPSHLKFTTEYGEYAIALLILKPNIVLAHYSNNAKVIWDLAKKEMLHTIYSPQESSSFIFEYGEYFYLVEASGVMNIYYKESYELYKSVRLGNNVNKYCINQKQNMLIYEDSSTKELLAMDLQSHEIILKVSIEVDVQTMDFADNILVVGGSKGEVFSFEIF